VLQDDLA